MGWLGYFRLASAKTHCEQFDQWIRRWLRMCLWKQWKRVRTRIRELRALGVPDWACFVMANTRSYLLDRGGGVRADIRVTGWLSSNRFCRRGRLPFAFQQEAGNGAAQRTERQRRREIRHV